MRINCKAVLCSLATIFVLIGVSGMELLKNGNFQTMSQNHPTNWIFYDWKGLSSLSIEQEDQSNIVLISSGKAGGKATFTQNIFNLELKEGSTVKFSGWYKTEDISLGDKGMLRIECIFNKSSNAKDKKFARMNKAVNLAPSPGKWEEFESTITLISPVADLNFFILGYNFSGNLYLRDVSVEAIQQTSEIKSN